MKWHIIIAAVLLIQFLTLNSIEDKIFLGEEEIFLGENENYIPKENQLEASILKDLIDKIKGEKEKNPKDDPDESSDINFTFEQIVTRKLYPLFTYYVYTADGYILKLFRIPGPKHSNKDHYKEDPKRKVVLLQHGLFDSSDSWITNYESKALAFILANKGYDVWMGNNRGNKHSRNHVTLNPSIDKEFWHYSFHEMGTLDLPAIIEYIRSTTGRDKISYIGHSQGTAQLFAAATLDPDYFASRLNSFFAFGPITNISNVSSTFLRLLAKTRLDIVLSAFGIHEILENGDSVTRLQAKICGFVPSLCSGLLRLISEVNTNDDDMLRFLVFISHFPAGSSLRTLQHFSDNIRNSRFCQLDNWAPYPLANIKNLPIFLYVGKDDMLATPKDSQILREALSASGVVQWYKEYEDMGHATFFLSKTNKHLDDLIPELDKINS